MTPYSPAHTEFSSRSSSSAVHAAHSQPLKAMIAQCGTFTMYPEQETGTFVADLDALPVKRPLNTSAVQDVRMQTTEVRDFNGAWHCPSFRGAYENPTFVAR